MQSIEETDTTLSATRLRAAPRRPRLWTSLVIVTLLLLLTLLPPLINLSRYQRRIATSMSLSLGRPVHLDHVVLNLLPLPGFTLTNLVVEENPAFGDEPIIRANTVRATLRFNSLWRRRVEFSRISFTDPSVNLVLDTAGRWNLADVLQQAAHVEAAPTAQRRAGPSPRFPYIEATGARLNLKIGPEKTPFSLTDADFALWLPEPQQWRMRLRARPMRTDTSASDTGIVQMEATLNRAPTPSLVPLSVELAWRSAPLADVSRLVLGRDAGLRGTLELSAKAAGTPADSTLAWHVGITGLHRSDFVPAKAIDVEAECAAHARYNAHALDGLRCSWPVPDSDGAIVALTGSLPDLTRPQSANLQLGSGHLPASTLLTWLRVASSRIPSDLTASGSLSASLSHTDSAQQPWSGQAILPDPQLTSSGLGGEPLATGPVTLTILPTHGMSLNPVKLPLGGREAAVIDGTMDSTGYLLHLSGSVVPARLLALGSALPQLGDGLAAALSHGEEAVTPPTNATSPSALAAAEATPAADGEPVHLDLTAQRSWGGAQVWIVTPPHPSQLSGRRERRR